MKKYLYLFALLLSCTIIGQNITVDSQTYSAQQLVEDILIDSDCITNVVVTNVLGGDFSNTDQSYGFFDATGTSFPFQSGIVLSTGRLANVPGPNDSLSDDDAPNWNGDNDLEVILNESNTTNATILEFDFTAIADQISFKYLFASEEYQENDPNTCQFSDLFGFLIRPINDSQYTNIALVPNTQTPVKVTTVHPDIPGGCDAINELYFESFNGSNVPINFNGQTTVLTATATTIPNESYHVKLVIADEQNYRFDSAVFLEAGSFQLSVDLGADRLLATGNPLCENETLILNAFHANATSYKWFKDGVDLNPIPCINCFDFEVVEAGTYNVEVTLDNNCIAYGEINIEYAENPIVFNATIIACDENQDGLTIYNLFDSQATVTNNEQILDITNFFLTQNEAEQNTNEIESSTFYENTIPFQKIYARVENQFSCFSVAEVTLEISTNTLNIPDFEACDDEPVDGFTSFNLNDLQTQIEPLIPTNATIAFFTSTNDSFADTNQLNSNYTNTIQNSETIYARITTEDNQCYALTDITLNVKATPTLLENDEILYCLNTFPETIILQGGIINDSPSNYYYQWLKDGIDISINTSFIEVNETGTYTVIATDPNGCSASRDITLIPSNIATIDDIIITEGSFSNNTITVLVSGEGEYQYKLDNGDYQDSNTFTNVISGFHTVFIKDIKNDCGIIEEIISVFGTPNYFTPNGDSIHETWKPVGITEANNNIKSITVFNRFGKLLAQLNPLGSGWNGTNNGENLPNDDYWYIISFINGKQITGHFALVR